MSGIVAIHEKSDSRLNKGILDRATERIAHRGSDGTGIHCDGPTGLGQQTLYATPEARGVDPPVEVDELVVVADVRLDNRDQLRDTLNVPPTAGRPVTDIELLAAAYARWGVRCPENLLGAFAFAIWDRADSRLFCARDHFGIRPLYYHLSDDRFACASECKALFELPGVSKTPNERRIADFLSGKLDDTHRSYYREISRLPPAHAMVVSTDVARTQRYWSLDHTRELRLPSRRAYARRFRELFTEAVRCRLRGLSRTGVLLSGGLDSSSIACTAETADGEAATPTFSVTYEEFQLSDEREHLRTVLDSGRFEPHFVVGEEIDPFGDFERQLFHQERPFSPAELGMFWRLLQSASDANVGTVLTGYGGDQVLSHGRAALRSFVRDGQIRRLAREFYWLADRWGHDKSELFWNQVVRPFVPRAARRAWWTARTALSDVSVLPPIIDTSFANRVGLTESVVAELLDGPPSDASRQHRDSIREGYHTHVFETMNKMAAALGVEPRLPFYDKRLVEFCVALPPEQTVRLGMGRYPLRVAMEGRLPPSVQWRTDKAGFSPVFVAALQRYNTERLRSLVDTEPKSLPIAPYVNHDALRKEYAAFDAEGDFSSARLLERPLVLNEWLSSFERV